MWMFVPEPSSPSALDTEASTSGSELLAPEFGLWVLSSGKPMRLLSSQVEWSKAPWIHVLSGTIWNPSTANRSAAAWISLLPASHVRAPASPESDSASKTSDGSGPRSGGSSARSARAGSSSKTFPGSSTLTAEPRSRKSSGTWHRAGGLRNGIVSPRDPSAPLTREIVSSCSLPTPTASQYGSSQNGINGVGGEFERPSAGRPSLMAAARRGMLPTPLAMDHRSGPNARGGDRGDGTHSTKLAYAAARLMPTPMASDAERTSETFSRGNETLLGATRRLLPTPRASDATKVSFDARDRPGGEGPTLPKAISKLAARGTLPTPTATDSKASGVAGNWTEESGRNSGATLTDVAVRGLDNPSVMGGGVIELGLAHWDWWRAPLPTIRGVDDGAEAGVGDGSWADQIHLLGNGAVPFAVAAALCILWYRLHGTALDVRGDTDES